MNDLSIPLSLPRSVSTQVLTHSYDGDGVYNYLCLTCKGSWGTRFVPEPNTFCPHCGRQVRQLRQEPRLSHRRRCGLEARRRGPKTALVWAVKLVETDTKAVLYQGTYHNREETAFALKFLRTHKASRLVDMDVMRDWTLLLPDEQEDELGHTWMPWLPTYKWVPSLVRVGRRMQ